MLCNWILYNSSSFGILELQLFGLVGIARRTVPIRVVCNFGICQIVQIGKNLGFSGSKTIIILAMFAKNRKIPALNLALRN